MDVKYLNILKKYSNPQAIPVIKRNWNQYSRHYHNEQNHLIPLLEYIDKNIKHKLSRLEYDTIILAAFYHDVIYDPYSKTNEDDSIKFFIKAYNYIGQESNFIKQRVISLIECTKSRIIPSYNFLLLYFWKADNDILYQNIDKLIKYENLIREEFWRLDKSSYKENRIKFLQSCLSVIKNQDLLKLIEYIKTQY